MSNASDPGSLQLLHDIVLPADVPWWPPAPGWYVVITLVLLMTLLTVWWRWRHWQARTYRRQALNELNELRDSRDVPSTTVSNILILLKRTALTAYPRAQVASLSGTQWWAFLDQTSSGTAFTSEFGPLANDIVYLAERYETDSSEPLKALFNTAEHWIVSHQEPVGV